MLLQLISYVGIVLGFVFLVLSIASSLYYLSELVEEHTEPTRRFLSRAIYSIIVLYVLLWVFDKFPFKLTVFSIFSYYVYLQNLKKFPYVNLSDPIFVASCVLVVTNHYLWFSWFSNPHLPSLEERVKPGYTPPRIPSFSEVASFFGICVWFIPFALFVSLSANENVLPNSMDYVRPEESGRPKKAGLAKVVFGQMRDSIYSISRRLGYELDSNRGRIV